MYIKNVSIENYGCLKNINFQGHRFLVFIGANGHGKTMVLEALYRFFNEFNPISGNAQDITDYLWFRRDVSNPIEIRIEIEMNKDEAKRYLPSNLISHPILYISEKRTTNVFNISIYRQLLWPGNWRTQILKINNIPIILNDALTNIEMIQKYVSFSEKFSDYLMIFFEEEYNKNNIGGERIFIDIKSKKIYKGDEFIDILVKCGVIESINALTDFNKFESLQIESLDKVAASVHETPFFGNIIDITPIITPEILQQTQSHLSNLRGVLKLLPAARDIRTIPGQRTSLLDGSLIQMITNFSLDRTPTSEKKWEDFKRFTEATLRKRAEPNPAQFLLKELEFGLTPCQIGGGEQVIIGILWEFIKDNNQGIWAIEEPENHLHPRLQRELLNYFKEISESVQIILCTHSPIFSGRSDISNIYLITKDDQGISHLEVIDDTNINRIIEDLGIRSSDILDFDIVFFVEGKDDVRIYSTISKKILRDFEKSVGFIDAEGWNSMAYYANAKILQTHRIKNEIFVIFDGDTEIGNRNKDIKERLTHELDVPTSNIITLKQPTIESYLLVPEAINRAFPNLRLTTREIQIIIEKNVQKRNKKEILDIIFKKGNLGSYKGEMGSIIAQSLRDDEIDKELRDIFYQCAGIREQNSSKNTK